MAEVTPGGPADKAGLKVHDVLLAIDGAPLTDLATVGETLNATNGEELTLELMRSGERMKIKVRPNVLFHEGAGPKVTGDSITFNQRIPGLGPIEVELEGLEEKIREKLKDAGIDVRMQVFRPGHFLSRIEVEDKLPEDLDIRIHKHGNGPIEIEVQQGEQNWSVTDKDLGELPEQVRKHVESLLGRTPGRFTVDLPGGQKFRVAVPDSVPLPPPPISVEEARRRAMELAERARAEVDRRGDEARRAAERKVEELAERAHAEVERQRDDARRAAERMAREFTKQARAEVERREDEVRHAVDRRLGEMTREMERMRERIEDLRKAIVNENERKESRKAEKEESDESKPQDKGADQDET